MTLHSNYSTSGLAVIPMSRFGEAIQELRELAGYAKQGEAATASLKLAAEYPDLFQAFSQQWLSRLEADETGDAIKKAQPLKMMALAYLLKLDSADFYERVGVAIAPVPLRERVGRVSSPQKNLSDTPFDPRTLFHPPVQREWVKRDLWPNLAEMIEEKGSKYPELLETRWQQHLTHTRFSGGQEPDADGWFEMFRAMERAGVDPEPWPEE
ncbi:hypothetical protein [Deinococcus ruber]|uniref:Uncharacterized protein n=1 Tax=Deinococcus ruber TaxID=1848197 RepID=A0A918C0X3_9DEIO|nr:hypothetical protein [Deinococcus ruber]GGR00057.1 hypothetical protein GCM10008957_10930 [Deinococcus ruber]